MNKVRTVLHNIFWGFLPNSSSRPNYNKWLNYHIPTKEIENPSLIKRKDREHFYPGESKVTNHHLELSDFIDIENATEELNKLFGKDWVKELFGKNAKEKGDEYLNALISAGFTEEQAKKIIRYAVKNALRAKDWSIDNEKVGKVASTFMSLALLFGVMRNLFSSENENNNGFFHFFQKVLDIGYSFTSTLRGYYQYSKHIYNRADDEGEINRYQSQVFGNKLAGGLASTAYITETKVNPILLNLVAIFSKSKKFLDTIMTLFMTPNLSWWRARMPAHINHGFVTDLLLFIVHKPLSLLGFQFSKNTVEEISKKGNIEFKYLVDRHYKNLGIKEKEKQTPLNFVKELGGTIVKSITGNGTKQIGAAKKAGETIAPLFGATALAATSIGIPLKLITKARGIESKPLDLFASFSMLNQFAIYLFKMVIPELSDYKKILVKLNDKNYTSTLTNEEKISLKLLLTKKKNLALLGLTTFLTSTLNSTLKLFKFENVFLEKLKMSVESLAGDLIGKFFSERRHTLGYQFRVENPELFSEELHIK